ncbi:HAMP domain-containing sensor histidine kinase [Angustibacter sp. McL0619]|uniref:HAMP domain-containing sensor histidine kinase n=1 Tax=Angustibacter sp. McL0619 TaxID=3415676 RepID=UPI003CF238FD
MSPTVKPTTSALVRDLRPLDSFHSIKIKLGILVAATCSTSAIFVWAGLHNELATRYTLPLSVLFSLAVTQVLARGMTSPLREMTAAAQAMARGDYSRRVRATSNDEVGDLSRAFNRMAEDLGDADRQRRELVANVSHELRTPVSALRAVLENLVDGVTSPDDASLRAALAQTERLGDLVTQLLDLSRVEAGAVPLHLGTIGLQRFFTTCTNEAELAGRDVRYVVDVEPPDLSFVADQDRLHQVLANLLDNAARHSPPGGTVTARARASAGTVQLDVIDQGPGIDARDRGRVFDRFHRGGASALDGGTGLGLAIARWVVDLHEGTIRVAESTSGCDIRVTLPQRPDDTGH